MTYPCLFVLEAPDFPFGRVRGVFCTQSLTGRLASCMMVDLGYAEVMELFEELEKSY